MLKSQDSSLSYPFIADRLQSNRTLSGIGLTKSAADD